MRNRRLLLGQANEGSLVKIRVFKLVQFIQTSLLLSEKFARIVRRTPSIVTQSDDPQKRIRLGQTILPIATRLGFAGAVVIIMWWSWPGKSNSAISPWINTVIPAKTLVSTNALN